MDTFNESLGLKIPGHVAVILDGNGRWAKKRHLPRTMGHVQGSKVVEDMLYVVDEPVSYTHLNMMPRIRVIMNIPAKEIHGRKRNLMEKSL